MQYVKDLRDLPDHKPVKDDHLFLQRERKEEDGWVFCLCKRNEIYEAICSIEGFVRRIHWAIKFFVLPF